MQTNSFISNVMVNGTAGVAPEVGMGVTMCHWTDRTAGTVIKVMPCTVTVQEDKAIRTDSNGMSEAQAYTYERDPNGPIDVFRKTKRGWRSSKSGAYLVLGHREKHYDYSF
jgi:hypothetical protein